MLAFLENADEGIFARVAPLVELGLHHEQQHQELLVTDIKHIFGSNPLLPAYMADPRQQPATRVGYCQAIYSDRGWPSRDRRGCQKGLPGTTNDLAHRVLLRTSGL